MWKARKLKPFKYILQVDFLFFSFLKVLFIHLRQRDSMSRGSREGQRQRENRLPAGSRSPVRGPDHDLGRPDAPQVDFLLSFPYQTS